MTLLQRVLGKKCRMCGRHGITIVGSVPLTQHGAFDTEDYLLQHCPKCEIVYLDPLPSAHDLKLMYEESDQFTDEHYTAPERVSAILEFYDSALRDLQLMPPDGGKSLEVGAGFAWVSRACKARESGVITVAQDVSAECAQKCPWVDHYFVGSLEAISQRGPFHLISLTHVIEHLPDPAAMLRQVDSLLAPNGKVFITAPYRPSGWSRTQGIQPWLTYSYLHVPAHITYFSRRWFEKNARAFAIEFWDATAEDGQAFTLVLRKR